MSKYEVEGKIEAYSPWQQSVTLPFIGISIVGPVSGPVLIPDGEHGRGETEGVSERVAEWSLSSSFQISMKAGVRAVLGVSVCWCINRGMGSGKVGVDGVVGISCGQVANAGMVFLLEVGHLSLIMFYLYLDCCCSGFVSMQLICHGFHHEVCVVKEFYVSNEVGVALGLECIINEVVVTAATTICH